MEPGNRPLSPHLQIYRRQITSVLSISHRLTGVVLTAGLLLLVYWLVALASGDAAYASAASLLGSWPVRILLLLATFAFFFHFANGIRHLWWDTGRGFEIPEVIRSGWLAIIVAGVLTLATWAVLLLGGAS
jgi:succinate dehydrogenase / fumarate reductase, cytochrome b subunit